MIRRVRRVTIEVRDQEEALRFYVEKLGLEKRADWPLRSGARWLTVAPSGESALELVLQPTEWFEGAERERRAALIGQSLELVFEVDDCHATYAQLQARGVQFLSAPEETFYGVEAVAQDLYGNSLVLLEFRARSNQ
jgi:catechol 2,3-dioxygenase-like lactoylglutathione lyase family enzyme